LSKVLLCKNVDLLSDIMACSVFIQPLYELLWDACQHCSEGGAAKSKLRNLRSNVCNMLAQTVLDDKTPPRQQQLDAEQLEAHKAQNDFLLTEQVLDVLGVLQECAAAAPECFPVDFNPLASLLESGLLAVRPYCLKFPLLCLDDCLHSNASEFIWPTDGQACR
jgi:hypothetical protein